MTTELFSDLFDHFADEDDDYEDMDDLDSMMNIKQQQEEEECIDQEDTYDDVGLDETCLLFDESKPYQTIEEQVLSQKLSQLSTSNKEGSPPLKKIRKENVEHLWGESSIPIYLSTTTQSFRQMLAQQPWFKENKNNEEEDLRQIAILMHKLAVNHLQNDLWMTYMKSGTGRLKKTPINEPCTQGPPIWPVKVKSFILSQRVTTAMTIEEENKACLNFVHQFLTDLNKKTEQYQYQLLEKKNAFLGYTEAMEKGLQTYIEQQRLSFLRLKCHLKQTLIDHDYQEQLLAMNYNQHHSNEYLREVAQGLYSLKYELEKAKQQVALLKQRIVHNSPPKSLDSIDHLSRLASIDRIHDSTIRQRLSHRQDTLLQQTKTDMIAILITSAEATMRQWQKEFDLEMAKLWHDYRHSSSDQRLTKPMMDLLDERLNNVTQRFQAIYNFKNNYFFCQAPTVHPL